MQRSVAARSTHSPAATRAPLAPVADHSPARPSQRPAIQDIQQSLGNQAMLRRLDTIKPRDPPRISESTLVRDPAVATRLTQSRSSFASADDLHEQEADRASSQLAGSISAAEPAAKSPCACGGSCPRCSAKDRPSLTPTLTPTALKNSTPPALSPLLEDGRSSPGQPLSSGTRAFMEARFHADFSDVRLHTNDAAARSARSIKARAYTVGSDVIFAANQYSPATAEGRKLLAHELAHVVQQGYGAIAIQRAPDETDDKAPVKSAPRTYTFDPDAYLREIDRKKQDEQTAREQVDREEAEIRHDSLMILRTMLAQHGYAKSVIRELLEAAGKAQLEKLAAERGLPAFGGFRNLLIVRHFGCAPPTFWTKQETYQNCVIEALNKYDDEWKKTHGAGGGPSMRAFSKEDQAALDRKRFNQAWTRGLGSVTGSLGGATGAAIAAQFTDDPEKIADAAEFGANVTGTFGSFALAKGSQGSYSPRAAGGPKVPAAVGAWRYGAAPVKDAPPPTGGVNEPPAGRGGEPLSDMRGDLTPKRDVVIRDSDVVHAMHGGEAATTAKAVLPETPEALPPQAITHVFEGDYEGGYHSTARGPNPNVTVLKVRGKPDGSGVYKVKIEIQDPRTGARQQKDSTMFPDSWSEARILDETRAVIKANKRGPVNADGVSMIEGVSPSGVTIRIVYEHGVSITFHPVLGKGSK